MLSGWAGLGATLNSEWNYDSAPLPGWGGWRVRGGRPGSRVGRGICLRSQVRQTCTLLSSLVRLQLLAAVLAAVLAMLMSKATSWDYYLGVLSRTRVCKI